MACIRHHERDFRKPVIGRFYSCHALTACRGPATSGGAEARKLFVEGLYRRFGPAVYRRAFGLLRNAEDASDVMQDAFLAFLKNERFLRGEASPYTVLYQIATYKALDLLRRRARWSGALSSLGSEDDEGTEHPLELATAHTGSMARVDALNHLVMLTSNASPRALMAAVLYFVEGYTLKEVGETLHLSRRKTTRLLRQLAEHMRRCATRIDSSVL
jgi:RNA polymerase sigma-70 factor (ECF subfamily)